MLRFRIDTEDEFNGLAGSDKVHYAQQDDGTYTLQVDGVLTEDQVKNLRSAYDKEKELRRQREAEVRDLRTKFENVDLDKVAEWKEIAEKVANKKLLDEEGFAAALQKHTAAMTDTHKRELAQIQKDRDEAMELAKNSHIRWQKDRLRNELLRAGAEAGVDTRSHRDLLLRGEAEGRLDEKGRVFFVDDNDDPIIGPNGLDNMTPEEWLSERKKDTNWFGISTGGGAHHRDSTAGGGMPPSHLSPSQRLTWVREQQRRRSA